MMGKTAQPGRLLRHNALHCSAAIIRADMELGLDTKRSLQPWTQVLGLSFSPNPAQQSEHGAVGERVESFGVWSKCGYKRKYFPTFLPKFKVLRSLRSEVRGQ